MAKREVTGKIGLRASGGNGFANKILRAAFTGSLTMRRSSRWWGLPRPLAASNRIVAITAFTATNAGVVTVRDSAGLA